MIAGSDPAFVDDNRLWRVQHDLAVCGGKEEIRLETWYDKHTSEFVVDITQADGLRDSKRFLNDRVFHTWLAASDRQLAVEGWKQSGPFLSTPNGRRSHQQIKRQA
jgi:hypothetical protein